MGQLEQLSLWVKNSNLHGSETGLHLSLSSFLHRSTTALEGGAVVTYMGKSALGGHVGAGVLLCWSAPHPRQQHN
jgi:hypothetical protein